MDQNVRTSVYPRLIEDNVFICGFNSPKSYGATSYFVQHPDGNWLIDSPRLEPYLIDQFEKMGGLKFIFLTHRDDVADAAAYARHFGASKIIHEADQRAMPSAEIILRGVDSHVFSPDFTAIPVPGHTQGHMVLLYKNKFLFTGDHLEWDRPVAPTKDATTTKPAGSLNAFRDFCWYDWNEQTRSMEKLLRVDFEWVLPGHGNRIKLPAGQMKEELTALVERMRGS